MLLYFIACLRLLCIYQDTNWKNDEGAQTPPWCAHYYLNLIEGHRWLGVSYNGAGIGNAGVGGGA